MSGWMAGLLAGVQASELLILVCILLVFVGIRRYSMGCFNLCQLFVDLRDVFVFVCISSALILICLYCTYLFVALAIV